MRESRNPSRMRLHLFRSAVIAALLMAGVAMLGQAADHRDGPIFGPPGITITNSRRDLNDVYAFVSPTNANNTVLILDVSPFAGATTPNSFDPAIAFELKVDNNGDAVEDIRFRVTFGPPDGNGIQQVTLRGLPSTVFPANGGILARGNTRTNLPVVGGGTFRAGEQDDPFFFDSVGFNQLLNGGSFPRPVGTAVNFFGPNVNTLSMILEIQSSRLRSSPGNPNIGVWAISDLNGQQIDRMGRPAVNTALIPPVPRGSNITNPGPDVRTAFNAGLPKNDLKAFGPYMLKVLSSPTGLYKRTQNDAQGLVNFLLPDILTFDTSSTAGFPNGRRLRDDVIDIELNLLTGGVITTDNVGDDNGTRITDGNMGTVAAFPYIGAANASPTGVTPTPPP